MNTHHPGDQVRSHHPYAFRPGEWATLLAVGVFQGRPCYTLRYGSIPGAVDHMVVDDPDDVREWRAGPLRFDYFEVAVKRPDRAAESHTLEVAHRGDMLGWIAYVDVGHPGRRHWATNAACLDGTTQGWAAAPRRMDMARWLLDHSAVLA